MNMLTIYGVSAGLLLAAGYAALRLFLRQDSFKKGRLSLLSVILGSLIFFLILSTCDKDPVKEESPYPLAEAQNIDGQKLAEAYAQARQIEGMKCLLVARNGVLVAEEYFREDDGPESLHDVRSVTKSVTSALIGIAIEEGFIENVDQTLADYLIGSVADSIEKEKGQITLRQLLTMSCGLEWFEIGTYSEYSNWITAPDQIEYILNKPMVTTPGTVFNYSDGAAHLVSVILTEATGMNALEFAGLYLFAPLDISGRPWRTDNRGYNLGGVALQITPRDMLKFGTLYLQNGVYDGKQVIAAEWVSASTQSHISTNNAVPYGPNYGYYWWTGRAYARDYYFANGYGGQFIVVVPGWNLVAVATGNWRGIGRDQAGAQWYNIISVIMNDVLGAVR
jgi:CubicO group peptidase (beta-lactamase class C family)